MEIKKKIQKSFLYCRKNIEQYKIPVLFIHGIGGHHKNFLRLYNHLNSNEYVFEPYFCDIPGFGHSEETEVNLSKISDYLNDCAYYISSLHSQPVIISVSSGGLWLLPNELINIDDRIIFFDNPIDLVDIKPQNGLVDVRMDFLAHHMSDVQMEMILRDTLGRGKISQELYMDCITNKETAFWHKAVKKIAFFNLYDVLNNYHVDFYDTSIVKYYFNSTRHGAYSGKLLKQTLEIMNRELENI